MVLVNLAAGVPLRQEEGVTSLLGVRPPNINSSKADAVSLDVGKEHLATTYRQLLSVWASYFGLQRDDGT